MSFEIEIIFEVSGWILSISSLLPIFHFHIEIYDFIGLFLILCYFCINFELVFEFPNWTSILKILNFRVKLDPVGI